MRCIFYTLADGSVQIGLICLEDGTIAAATDPAFEGMDEAQIIDAIVQKDRPVGTVSWRLGQSSELPSGREDGAYDATFAGALKDDGGRIVVDMPKARDIHRNRLRAFRGPLLAQLDVEYQRADEAGNAQAKAGVAARKQALRDLTKFPAIDAATTPGELKQAIPDDFRDDSYWA